ncbi:hypothetical protein [Cohnella zeiphila]|uniref:Butirosin biosynthesis protein H N-terminal domain-containing protein n=1 Tax=Cohnella zeiphila TaxID=2761120 RepID=A0A7X0VU42_9BACL|nr:hypothetical protein [Cohnella zeiphila]MBB6729985.1 hypothetical protein [Cohnella zeiphila]
MNAFERAISPGDLVKLAAMECFASCALTYARMVQPSGPRLPPDYWNLSYQFRTLLSSLDYRQMTLEFHYGIRLAFERGGSRSLYGELSSDRAAILLCSASRLPYFPPSMLGLESAGFRHCVLLLGLDPDRERCKIADPMADFVGELACRELELAGKPDGGSGREELHYFTLSAPPAGFAPPAPARIFRHASRRNLVRFEREGEPASAETDRALQAEEPGRPGDRRAAWAEWFAGRNGGIRAFDRFRQDLEATREWPRPAVDRWIERHHLTIASVWKLRSQVWHAFADLGVMTDPQLREGGDRVRRIVRLWQSLNYRLHVYRTGARAGVDAAADIAPLLDDIRDGEHGFLRWLCEAGDALPGPNEEVEPAAIES